MLAIASPVIAELLSGSAPPFGFFVPWVFVLFVLFYGCASILIRELTFRWGGGWMGIFLMGAAFGILQEGCATRAFFDPAWRSLGPLVGHGRWLGVNWIWSVDATLYHATYSVAIPILLTYVLFPSTQRQAWLSNGSLAGVATIFGLALAVFVHAGRSYSLPARYLIICVTLVLLLCVAAARVRPRKKATQGKVVPHLWFAALGFCATAGLILQIYALPQLGGAPLAAAMLVALVIVTYRLLTSWSGHGHFWSRRQQFGLLAGALSCFGLMDFFQEFNPSRAENMRGASLVGVAALAGLMWISWRLRYAERVAAAPIPAGIDNGSVPTFDLVMNSSSPFDVADAPVAAFPTERIPLSLRLVEIVVASSVLVLTSPLMLAMAILIRFGTPGRAIFRQTRVGMNLKPFKFVKFRTMYVDARQRFPELYEYKYSDDEISALKFKIVDDPRVTPQGKWMRKSTLDELPNFWNVLTGEMALVGPRPEIPEMLPYYSRSQLLKFTVRPGITGLAQISGRGYLSFQDTVNLDVEYVKRRSLLVDLKIFFFTVYKMVTQDGAF